MRGSILHHALAGAIIGLLFSTPKKAWLYLIIGMIGGLLPDITKVIFGDLYLHSLVGVPIVSVLLAAGVKLCIKSEAYARLFSAVFASMAGHLVLDFLNNGNPMLYPWIKAEAGYSLITEPSPIIWGTALAAITKGFLLKRVRLLAVIGLSIITLYIGYQAVSKAMVTSALHDNYPFPETAVDVFPNPGELPWGYNWSYQLRSDVFLASGDSNTTGSELKQINFYYVPPEDQALRYRVEEVSRNDGHMIIRCLDETTGQNVYFTSEDGVHWSR